MVMMTMRRGLITSSMPMGGGPSQETAPINAPMMNEDKHQPVMPALAPAEAPTQPIEKETESIQPLESKQWVENSEKGVEPTPEQPAEDPQGNENEDLDAMEVDHDHDDSEKDTLRKPFPERPSTAQLKGEKDTEETLEKPTPGQPSDKGGYGERSYPPAMESPERHDSDGEL